MNISVIICTHNPNPKYLDRTLNALKHQSLPLEDWELIIIDNASQQKVEHNYNVSWHPKGRFLREEKLGLTHARLKGISEARGGLLVFFDDDNVPQADYLEYAFKLAEKYPFIGAFGGNLIGELEIDPPEHLKQYLGMLAIREVTRIVYSTLYLWDTTPAGAGMIIRASIAQKYLKLLENSPLRQEMDRRGDILLSGGDNDLAFTAIDMGFACALFPQLSLIHIIPRSRVQPDYLLKLSKYIAASNVLLYSLRPGSTNYFSMAGVRPLLTELNAVLRFEKSGWKRLWFEWRRFWSIRKGEKMARDILRKSISD